MDEMSPAPPEPRKPGRPGRKPKNSLAAKNAATPPPAKSTDTAEKAKNDEKSENSADTTTETIVEKSDKVNDKSSEKAMERAAKASEKKQAAREMAEAIIDSGGRSKRTRKPNPRYMDEPVVSAKKHLKDDSADSENAEGEDGDDEMQSSDEPRNEGPLKKRMLQKHAIKSGPGRKPGGSAKGTPVNAGRKSIGAVATKRKIEIDIDIDDEHGKKLFLDAQRRLTLSAPNSDEDLRRGKTVGSDLAAKLRSKFPQSEFIVKRNVAANNQTITANRVRVLERNKVIQKEELIVSRKRKNTEDTETSEDDSMINKGVSDHEALSPKNNSRRKTQHTKILSDDRIVRGQASNQLIRRGATGTTTIIKHKSPFTPNQSIHSKTVPTKTYSLSPQSHIVGSNKPAILRPPPRILNSTLCKPANKSTVPSLVTKLITKDDYEQDVNNKRNNNIISSRSKENNVTSYTYTEKDGKMIPKKNVVQLPQHQQQMKMLQQRRTVLPIVRTQPKQQKIISEPVSMNLPNSRRIRKITCFETWYVIKMAEEQLKPEKSILNMSLMQIGNEIKKIELPSDEWTYKILLQPLSKEMLAMRAKTKANEIKAANDAKATEDSEEKSKESDANQSEANKTETDDDGDAADSKKEDSLKNNDDKKTDDEANEKSETDEHQKEDLNDRNIENDDKSAESDAKSTDNENGSGDGDGNVEGEGDEKKDTKSEEEIDEKSTEQPEDDQKKGTEAPENTENKHDVYTGEVHDPSINVNERHNYRPINIMFRRKCQNPGIRIQFDRTVILKNQTFYLNIDGKNVRLVASPQSIENYDDIKSLLQIIDDVSLNSCCVELATPAV